MLLLSWINKQWISTTYNDLHHGFLWWSISSYCYHLFIGSNREIQLQSFSGQACLTFGKTVVNFSQIEQNQKQQWLPKTIYMIELFLTLNNKNKTVFLDIQTWFFLSLLSNIQSIFFNDLIGIFIFTLLNEPLAS